MAYLKRCFFCSGSASVTSWEQYVDNNGNFKDGCANAVAAWDRREDGA